jgi:hypothetical protein
MSSASIDLGAAGGTGGARYAEEEGNHPGAAGCTGKGYRSRRAERRQIATLGARLQW